MDEKLLWSCIYTLPAAQKYDALLYCVIHSLTKCVLANLIREAIKFHGLPLRNPWVQYDEETMEGRIRYSKEVPIEVSPSGWYRMEHPIVIQDFTDGIINFDYRGKAFRIQKQCPLGPAHPVRPCRAKSEEEKARDRDSRELREKERAAGLRGPAEPRVRKVA